MKLKIRSVPLPEQGPTLKIIRYRWQEALVAYLFLLPLLVGVVLFFVIPISQAFYYSLTKWRGIGAMTWIGLDNFAKLFSSDLTFRAELRNTIVFVFGSIPGTLVLAVLAATLMNARIKGVSFYRVIYFLPNVTMVAVVAMIWRWLLNSQFGIVNAVLRPLFGIGPAWMSDTRYTLFSMCIIAIWSGLGYCIVILLAGLQGISPTYYEAACIDGATPVQQFFRITVPLLTPTLFFLLVTRVIGAFNQFDLVYMLADSPGPIQNSLRTIVFGIYQSGFQNFAMGYACAKAVVLFAIVMVVTFIQFKGEKRWVHY
jgi:multiple sugar transport system permease protein